MYDNLFAQIAEEIPGYAGAVVGALDGSGYTAQSDDFDLATLSVSWPTSGTVTRGTV
jgi:hypothetical protein